MFDDPLDPAMAYMFDPATLKVPGLSLKSKPVLKTKGQKTSTPTSKEFNFFTKYICFPKKWTRLDQNEFYQVDMTRLGEQYFNVHPYSLPQNDNEKSWIHPIADNSSIGFKYDQIIEIVTGNQFARMLEAI